MAGKSTKKEVAPINDENAKAKALETAIAQLDKKFGKGTVMKLSGQTDIKVSTVSTGSMTLDIALGVGGLPRGRIVEIFGPESSGKTTIALHAVAEVQKSGGIAAFVDAEHALDPVYAKALGVNLDELLISQPDSGEQALEVAESLVRSGAVDIVIVDSVAALVPQQEIDGDMGQGHVGLHARLMSQALRKMSGAVAKANAIVVFINQLREKVGVIYGNPEVTTGGRALKFYASIRIEVRASEKIKDGNEMIGAKTKCKVVKNKVAPPFKTAEFDMIYGKGISKIGEIIDAALELGIVERSGAWFYYNEQRIGQGRDNAKKFIEDSPEIQNEIEAKIRAHGLDNSMTSDDISSSGDLDDDGFDISVYGLDDSDDK